MNFLKDMDVLASRDRYYTDTEHEAKYNSTIRHLLCRMIDVYEKFPKEFSEYADAKEEWLRDFIGDDNDYSFSIEKRGNKYYLNVTDYRYGDSPIDEKIKIPSCILEDDWEKSIAEDLEAKRVRELEKEIDKLKEFIKNAPDKLLSLENELRELNTKYKVGDIVGVFGYETDVKIHDVQYDGYHPRYLVSLADGDEWIYDDDIAYKIK